jgi:hypothetical protein
MQRFFCLAALSDDNQLVDEIYVTTEDASPIKISRCLGSNPLYSLDVSRWKLAEVVPYHFFNCEVDATAVCFGKIREAVL